MSYAKITLSSIAAIVPTDSFPVSCQVVITGKATDGTLRQAPALTLKVQPGPVVTNRYWIGLAGLDLPSIGNSPDNQWFVGADLMQALSQGHRWWSWLNVSIGSIPTAKPLALSSQASVSTAVTTSGIQNVGDITQSLGFRGGITTKFWPGPVSLVFEVNGTSPSNPITGAEEYNLGPQLATESSRIQWFSGGNGLQQLYLQLWGSLQKCTAAMITMTSPGSPNCPSGASQCVAFVLPSRTRFYREWAAGIRIRTKESAPFPGITDPTFGEDETVTAGMLRGAVMTLNSEYPIKDRPFYLFGSVHLRLASNRNNVTLDMTPATSPVSATDPSVVLQSPEPADQGYFRIGIAVDISQARSEIRQIVKNKTFN